MRQESRKLAFCGMTAALAATLLTLGGIVPLATYACPLLAMLALVPVTAEYGAPAGLAAYAAAALLSLLLTPDKEIACLFLFLGYYPALRPRLDRIRSRLLRALAKLALAALSVSAAYALLLLVFSSDALRAEFAGLGRWVLPAMALLGGATFLLFDRVLARLDALWLRRFARKAPGSRHSGEGKP